MKKNYKKTYGIIILSIQMIILLIYGLSLLDSKIIDINEMNFNYIYDISGIANNILSPKQIKISDNRTIVKEEDNLYFVGNTDYDIFYSTNKLIQLKLMVENRNKEFLFISLPSKYYSNIDFNQYGLSTNQKEKQEQQIEYTKKNMNILDLNQDLYNKYQDDLFYKTDHHWKVEYALEAAYKTAEYLNENYHYNLNLDNLKEENFEKLKGTKWLGELGRKTSKTWAGLDDFTIIKPNYDTSLSTEEVSGSFDILLDNKKLEKKKLDYYQDSNYYSYCYVCKQKITIHNNKVSGPKVLLIHDSYAMAYAPFLSLVVEDLTLWDMRKAEEKLMPFIENNDFDIIIVAYTPLFRKLMYNFF